MVLILLIIIFIASLFLLYSLYNKNQELKFYKALSSDKYWIIWSHPKDLYLSPTLQQKIQGPVTLKQVAYFMSEIEYSKILAYIQNLDKENFCIYVPHQDTLLEIKGQKIKNIYLLELHNLKKIRVLEETWHQTNTKLRSKYEHIKSIIDELPLAIWSRDQENKLNYCNKIYADFLETKPHKVVADQIELINNSHPNNVYHLSAHVLKTKQIKTVDHYFTFKGARFLFNILVSPHKCGTFGYATDKTEYDNLKRDLHNHVQSHQDIFHQLSTPIAVFNAEQRLSFFNKSYMILFEFDEKWLAQQPTFSEILDDLRQRQKIPEPADFLKYKNTQKDLFNNLFEPMEETLHLPNGKILRSVIAPQPSGGLLYMYEDITDHLHLEQQNKSLCAAQKEIIDHLYEGILIFGSDYRLNLSNPIVTKILSIPPQKHHTHLDEFIKDLESSITNAQQNTWKEKTLFEIFENRLPQKGFMHLDTGWTVQWTYSPLPDGSHLLSFLQIIQKAS